MILVKLPVALSGGSTLKRAPLAGAEALDRSGQGLVGIGIDGDPDALADPHPAKLGFLEVGDDMDGIERHYRHHQGSGADELPDLRAAIADHAIHRRPDDGALQIDPRQPQPHFGLPDPRRGFAHLRFQRQYPLAVRRQCRQGPGIGRIALVGVGFALVELPPRQALAADQDGGTLQVAPGPGAFGFGGSHGGARRVDRSTGLCYPCRRRRDRSRGKVHRRRRFLHLGDVFLVLQHRQDVAFPDRLVGLYRQVPDVARDLRTDGRDIGLHIGVVGRLDEARRRPPVPPAQSGACHQRRACRLLENAQAGPIGRNCKYGHRLSPVLYPGCVPAHP